jgi:putative tricarboxylic transport membrane protein
MVLGVVLGPLAEINLSRAIATSDDLTLFFTRPWALFFFVMAVFSVFFPVYQAARNAQKRWATYYAAAFIACLAVPIILMGGWFRTGLGIAFLVMAVLMFVKRSRAPITTA